MAPDGFTFVTAHIPKWLEALDSIGTQISSYNGDTLAPDQAGVAHIESAAVSTNPAIASRHVTEPQTQPNTASLPLTNAMNHPPELSHHLPEQHDVTFASGLPTTSPRPAISQSSEASERPIPRLSPSHKRKRDTPYILSLEPLPPPAKPRPRTKSVVYYNGEAQKTLAALHDNIHKARNILRRGAQARILGGALSDPEPAASKAAHETDCALETAQSHIENTAGEVLRGRAGEGELGRIKKCFENALEICRQEVARIEQESRLRAPPVAVVKERTLAPRVSHVTLVPVTYNTSTAIEVDEEEDDEEHEVALPAVRLMARRVPRV